MARCARHDKEMQTTCGVESCGLCYEESLAPPPPWACESCRLVNWPLGDGSARTACGGCGQARGGFRVFVGGDDVTDLVDPEALAASFEAEDRAIAEALTEREAFVERLERTRTMTYEQFLDADPWEA